MDIQNFRQKLERKKGQQNQVQRDLQSAQEQAEKISSDIKDTQQAQIIIRVVAQKTQQELEYRLSEIVSLALATIFDDPYRLKVAFEIRRGKTECDLLFEKHGEIFDPLISSGGGPIDIAAMALRITIWTMTQPRTNNVLLLDEPWKFVSKEYQQKASIMLNELAKKLKLQIIMVSHSETLIEGADKIFNVTIVNNISQIATTKKE